PQYADYGKALYYNKKVYEMAPGLSTLYALAKTYYLIGEYTMAEKHFAELIESRPDNTDYLIYQIYVKEALEKKEEAETIKAKVKKTNPDTYKDYFGEDKDVLY